jgi:hypothetical protein
MTAITTSIVGVRVSAATVARIGTWHRRREGPSIYDAHAKPDLTTIRYDSMQSEYGRELKVRRQKHACNFGIACIYTQKQPPVIL